MSDYPMLISNKLHSFRNFTLQNYKKESQDRHKCGKVFIPPKFLGEKQSVPHRETTCFTPRNKPFHTKKQKIAFCSSR